MRSPRSLQPTGSIALSGHCIALCRRTFVSYADAHDINTFGGKDLLLVDGKPQFAEVAILRAFEEAGWQGRWLETYGKGNMTPGLWREWKPGGSRAQVQVPIADAWVNEKLRVIAEANGNTFAGCWDVIAWKGDRLVFAESKKQKKDRMRDTQLRWLEAALKCGCALEDFLVVEWGM